MLIRFGYECYRNPGILLEMLGDPNLKRRASMLMLFIRAYIHLFGIPEIGHQLKAAYFKKLVPLMKDGCGIRRILDAGCGIGLYSFFVGKRFPLIEVDACDCDAKCVNVGNEILDELGLSNVHIFQADILKLRRRGKYDLILLIDVLEHIHDVELALRNLNRALKSGGILYVHVPQKPQKRHFKRYDRWERGLGLISGSKTHIREGYTASELTSLLDQTNFRIRYVRNTFGLVGSLLYEVNIAVISLSLGIAALLFPLLAALSSLDTLLENNWGNGLVVIADKPN